MLTAASRASHDVDAKRPLVLRPALRAWRTEVCATREIEGPVSLPPAHAPRAATWRSYAAARTFHSFAARSTQHTWCVRCGVRAATADLFLHRNLSRAPARILRHRRAPRASEMR